MGRKLLIVAGLSFTVVGALGLVLFGPVIVQVLLALTDQTLPRRLAGDFRWAAAAATLLALGATLLGFVAQRDTVRLTVSGKGLVALASLVMMLSTVGIAFGTWRVHRGFQMLAASETGATVGDLQSLVIRAELPVRIGFGLLALSQIFCLLAAIGLQPTEERARGPTVAKMAGVTYMLSGWITALLFLASWWQSSYGFLATVQDTYDVSIFARGVTGVWIKSALICFCLFIQAGCLAAIGFSALRR